MKLLCDEHNGIYVWVDEEDEEISFSPHFDYEEDAIQWRDTIYVKVLSKVFDSSTTKH